MKFVFFLLMWMVVLGPSVAFAAEPDASAAPPSYASPAKALFFPNEVQLSVEQRLTATAIPGKGLGFALTLPPNADLSVFSATVNGKPANGYYLLERPQFRPLPSPRSGRDGLPAFSEFDLEQETDGARRELIKAVIDLQVRSDEVSARIKATDARLDLWEKGKTRKEDLAPDQMARLDESFSSTVAALFASKAKDERLLRELDDRRRTAIQKVQEYGRSRTVSQTVVIPHDGPEGQTAVIGYTYLLPASFEPSYRITAYPGRNKVAVVQEAVVYQTSGVAWKDVEVFISTTRRDRSLSPASLRSWMLNLYATPPVAPAPYAAEAVMEQSVQVNQMNKSARYAAETEDLATAASGRPEFEEKGTFRLWTLGRRSIDNEVSVTLPLTTDEYDAKYYYTLIPSLSPRGFLTAELDLAQALELPQGTARFFVDDLSVGQRRLSLNGNRATLFFGSDPQVTAVMRDVEQTSGSQGIISKDQTRLLHWEILVRNGRGRELEVRIQDPIPEARNEAIKLTVESKPKPEETRTALQLGATRVYQWTFSLKPGESRTIEHKVRISAPADKFLDTGRR